MERTVALHLKGSGVTGTWGRYVSRWLLSRSRHCVAAPWLADELKPLAVEAVCLPFPSPTVEFEQLALSRDPRPDRFRILTYIPDHNPANYCGEEIVHAARLLPDVDFLVMGGSGSWCKHQPENLEFLGWTNAAEQYCRTSVVVRAVRHDALGGTVREALLCGCYVIYTFPHPNTTLLELTGQVAADGRRLADAVATFNNCFTANDLPLNLDARQWVLENLGEAQLARNLVGFLNA
ncbi:hypothetical protein N6L25_16555 [Marinobacter sp. SS21]|nr:hypothetical protein [Marinobacter sp. SS21]